jgi:platelet-activating factor acetylhydrolase IB subunit beta/gamma
MLERFKTTGHDLKLGLHPHILNLGCSGDTIPNVLYRLSLGVLEKVKGKGEGIRIVIVNIGSNDFKKNGRPFGESQVWEFGVLIEVLRRMGIGVRVVVTGLFYRKGLERESVDASNAIMKNVVEEMEGVEWLDAPEVSMESAFADHVHLNRKGYEVWDNWLVEKLDL